MFTLTRLPKQVGLSGKLLPVKAIYIVNLLFGTF